MGVVPRRRPDQKAEVRLTDDPVAVTGLYGNALSNGLVPEKVLMLHSSLDLAEVARLVLDASVPDLADAAAVFVLDDPHRVEKSGGEVVVRRLGTRLAHAIQPMTQATFPAGEVIALGGDSPYARCMSDGEPVIFAQPDSQTLERVRPVGREMLSRYGCFLAVSAVHDGEVTGFVALARTSRAARFSDADVVTASRLAVGAGTGMANVLTLMRHRSIADTLQYSLLAAEPTVPPGLDVAARCWPAAGQIVGGDWYATSSRCRAAGAVSSSAT
jgi:hypothetical protein